MKTITAAIGCLLLALLIATPLQILLGRRLIEALVNSVAIGIGSSIGAIIMYEFGPPE